MSHASFCKLIAWPAFVYMMATMSGCLFSSKAQKRLFSKVEKEQFDAIIVPGLPFENGKWDRIMKGRVYWSKYLYDKGIAKNIIYSGSAVYSPYYESKIMALYATAIGIPANHIFTETLAEHTTENVYYSYKLAKKLGFMHIALASDPFQTKMMRRFIRKKIDVPIPVIPFVTDTLRLIEPSMIDPAIDYQQAFKNDFVSLKKREGFFKRWRGTRGKNMNVKAYDEMLPHILPAGETPPSGHSINSQKTYNPSNPNLTSFQKASSAIRRGLKNEMISGQSFFLNILTPAREV